jgi:hypothetical protein
MSDNPHWPFVPLENQHNKVLDSNPAIILYYPLTGGEFLAKILSCSRSLYGDEYIEYLKSYYVPKGSDWLDTYEDGHHPKLFPSHARYFTFNEWLQFDKIVYINYELTERETKWLLYRKNFIVNSVSNDLLADLQIKYEKELISFLDNKKTYYNFRLTAFLNQQDFVTNINNCLQFLEYETINKNDIAALYKTYMQLNFKIGGW